VGVIVALMIIVALVAVGAAEYRTAAADVASMVVIVAIAVVAVVAIIRLPIDTPLWSKVVPGTPVIRGDKTRLRFRGAGGQPNASGTEATG
jgi:hypothetical protein